MTPSMQPERLSRDPFVDPASEERWSAMSESQMRDAAGRDPIGFVADHLLSRDRRHGSVAVLLDAGPDGPRTIHVVNDAPLDPDPDQCRAILDRVAEQAVSLRRGMRKARLGVVHHRTGDAVVVDLDTRWAQALDDVTSDAGLGVLGVAARTESGALVRVPRAAAAA